jgi:CheY-like chemotaxis protein
MDGAIEVISEPGIGTTVECLLPLALDQQSAQYRSLNKRVCVMAQDNAISHGVAQALQHAIQVTAIGAVIEPSQWATMTGQLDAIFITMHDNSALNNELKAAIQMANREMIPVYLFKPNQLQITESIGAFRHMGLPFSLDIIRQLFVNQANLVHEKVDQRHLSQNQQLHLLVVEDNPINQQLLLELLEKEGHVVDIFDDANHALAAMNSSVYDMLLVDYHLPDLTGIEFIKACRDMGVKTESVIMTADISNELRDLCEINKIEHLITKPFKLQQLIEVINGT